MKNKKIPTIIGTILLLSILFFGVWLTLRRTNTVSKASGGCVPTGVQVTNLTNKSADISFLTSSTCSTSLTINGKTIPNFGEKLTTHYYRIDNLQSSTLYQYYIIANGQQYQQSSFNFKTAPQVSTELSTANLAWGKVVLASNQPSPNTIIYLNISGAWPLSALTDSDGQWHILLSNSFTQDKSAPFIPPTSGTEEILAYTPDGQLTQVENSLSKNDPVPNIIVGQGFASQLGTGPDPTITPTKTIIPTKILTFTPTSAPIIIDPKLPAFSSSPSATVVPTSLPTILPSIIPTIRTSKPSTKSGVPITGNANPFYLLILSSLFTLSFSLYFFNKDEK